MAHINDITVRDLFIAAATNGILSNPNLIDTLSQRAEAAGRDRVEISDVTDMIFEIAESVLHRRSG